MCGLTVTSRDSSDENVCGGHLLPFLLSSWWLKPSNRLYCHVDGCHTLLASLSLISAGSAQFSSGAV